jgi:hypothetical protein
MKELRIGLVGGLAWPHAQMMATTLNDFTGAFSGQTDFDGVGISFRAE